MLELAQNELRSSIIHLTSVKTKGMVLKVLNGIISILKQSNLVPSSALNIPNGYTGLRNYYLSHSIVDTTNQDYIDLNYIFHNKLSLISESIQVKYLKEIINLIISTFKLFPNIASIEDFEILRYNMLYQINSGNQFTFAIYEGKLNEGVFATKVSELSLLNEGTINNNEILIEINKLISLLKLIPGIVTLEDFLYLKSQFLSEEGIDIDCGNANTLSTPLTDYGNAYADLNSQFPL